MPKKKIVEEEPLETVDRPGAEDAAATTDMPVAESTANEAADLPPEEKKPPSSWDDTPSQDAFPPSLTGEDTPDIVSVNLLDGPEQEGPGKPESGAVQESYAQEDTDGIDREEAAAGEKPEAKNVAGEEEPGSKSVGLSLSEETNVAAAPVVEPPATRSSEEIQKERTPGEERRAFYNLDFNELDRDLSPEQRQEWNSIYASYRGRNAMSGTIVGVDQHRLRVRDRKTGAMTSQQLYCAIVIPFRVRILIPETEMWMKGEERPGFVLRNMPGAKIDFVIIHVDREAGFAVGSRRLAMPSRRYYFSMQPNLNAPGSRVSCDVLVVGPRRCLVSCYGYDVDLSQRELSYTAIPDLREVYHSGQALDCIVKTYDVEDNRLSISVKETIPNPYDGAAFRHPVQSHRQGVIAGKYGGGVFCNLPDGVTVMCSYSFHYDDSAFRSGDRVMLIIQHYDDKKKQIYGKIVAKC